MSVEVNYLAVFVAALSTMVVGAVWYSTKVFGATWMKLAKVKIDANMKPSQMAMMYGGVFIASLVSAFVLAHFVSLSYEFYKDSYSFLETALITGVWAWLAFTAARIFTHDTFEGRRKKLTLLTAGNEFITFLAMALVIGLMGV